MHNNNLRVLNRIPKNYKGSMTIFGDWKLGSRIQCAVSILRFECSAVQRYRKSVQFKSDAKSFTVNIYQRC